MSSDLVFIHDDILSDVADAIRFVEGSSEGIAPEDYAEHITALDNRILQPDVLNFYMPNGGTISLNKTGSPNVVELEYWLDDNGRWITWQPDSNGNRSLTLTAGQRMYVRNTSETQTKFSTSASDYYKFAFTDTVEAHGNINSLLCKNADSIIGLTYACYFNLFLNCASLVTAPELPATNVSVSSYAYMFVNCTSLVTAPELPDTTLAISCYILMFYGCISLREIRTQMIDISANDCINNWLGNVAATGNFYCPAELTIPTGASGIPSGWTRKNIQETIPLNFTMPNGGTISLNKTGSPTIVELEYLIEGTRRWITWTETNNVRSLTLTAGQKVYIRNTSETQTGFSTNTNNYYQFSFVGDVEAFGNTNSLLCKNTENVTTLSNYCYVYMFDNCTSLITAPTLPATTLYLYCYGYMFRNCISLLIAPELPATTLADYCYYSMFRSCESLVTAPELPATTMVTACYAYMLANCYSLVALPELLATTLAASCYFGMFNYCTSLREIRTRMTDISATNCISGWLNGVTAQGDFYCPAGLTIPTGANGIPSGWTRHDI